MSRILVVDDNESSRYLLAKILEAGGHEACLAVNGVEALARAEELPPDLVISDLLMPVMDGFTLCREWKSREKYKAIPFIVYTATYTEPQDEELALGLGADRYVVKPQEPQVLMEIVRDVLSKPALSAPRDPESENINKYSETLFRKLEKKMRDLERTISERARGEDALRESEAKYRIVADNAYNWEFWLGAEGEVKYISTACDRMTGRGCVAFLQNPALFRDIIHSEDLRRYDDHVLNVEKLMGEGGLEYRILHVDGSERWMAHDCMPVFSEDGTYLGVRGSNRDITEQKKLEERLMQAQKLEAVGRLSGGIAHDFNNILTAIIGYVTIIQDEKGSVESVRGYLDELLHAAERGANLTSGLLAFSRNQGGKLREVSLDQIIRGVSRFLRRIIGEDIAITMNLAEDEELVMADSGQIEQVLMNLAANARDAMPLGGTLSISTGVVDVDDQFVRMNGSGAPGRYVMVTVSDTGVGMDEKTRGLVFEPFFTTKEVGKGTGLGLSIVYGIVKRHDGFIGVYSEPGRGTSFRLFFKTAGRGVPTEDRVHGGQSAAPRGGSETVLIADDEPAIRNVLETYLSSLGYHVIPALDGSDAVMKFRENSDAIHLVILDTIMPKKNGRLAAHEIREVKPGTKILLMSGYPPDMIQTQGLAEAGMEFVLKPLKPLELGMMVRSILDKG